VRSRNHRTPSRACQKQLSARLSRGVPHSYRSAASSIATDHTTTLGRSRVGTVGDHVEPSEKLILWWALFHWASTPVSCGLIRPRIYPDIPVWVDNSADRLNYFVEITSTTPLTTCPTATIMYLYRRLGRPGVMAVTSVLLAVLRSLLALVFFVSALTKLADRGGFKSALRSFGVPERLQPALVLLVPVLELAIGIGLLPAASAWLAAAGALGLLIVFTVAIAAALVRGRRPECHCFGQFSSAPVTWKTVLRNGALMVATAAIVIMGTARPEPSLVTWINRLTLPEALGLIAAIVLAAVVSIETRMLARVLRQNGRLLLRIDALEESQGRAGLGVRPAARGIPGDPHAGLPVGAPAPAFRLDRLGGGTSTLAELMALGKPVMLAFVDPQCGPCTALLPELARWGLDLVGRLTLAVITTGSIQANNHKLAGHSLTHILLQKGGEIGEAYRAHGTPSMVLVEPSGVIGSPVAAGAEAIRGLMGRFTATQYQPGDTGGRKAPNLVLNGSNGAHRGVGAIRHAHTGEAAPDLRLPGIDGKQISLAAFRGQTTLVLFWNPACGFCLRMLDDLKAWEASRVDASPRLLVVSTGNAEINRAMGLRSPVVLDAAFESARAFGAGGTPSAVLVDKDGRVASEVAVGGPAVLALATRPVTTLKVGVQP